MTSFEDGIIQILIVGGSLMSGLFILYLISKHHPKLSRALHKTNCYCNTCYPYAKKKKEQVE